MNVSYSYDNDSRVSGITYNFGANLLGNLTYSYDSLGRRTQVGGSFARTGFPAAVTSASYDAANELTNWNGTPISYDLNGNVQSDGTNTFTWNARNQVASLNGRNLQYDAYGRRVQNQLGTAFLYDGANAAQELTGGTVSANLLSGGIDEMFIRADSAGTVTPLQDALGSTIALVDGSGNVATSYSYDPFGNTTSSGLVSSNPSQYTGRENEGNGLYFYRARYYSPSLHRFISEDPLGFRAGDLNFYAYVGNSPVTSVDPTGLTRECPVVSLCGAQGSSPLPLAGRKPTGRNPGGFWNPFDWKNYVPTHGNWCGPNWSGGWNPTLHGGIDGPAGPVNGLDSLCMRHDHLYEQTTNAEMKRRADLWLNLNVRFLDSPPEMRVFIYEQLLLNVAFPGPEHLMPGEYRELTPTFDKNGNEIGEPSDTCILTRQGC